MLGNSQKLSAGVFPDVADVQNLFKVAFLCKSTERNFTIALKIPNFFF